MFLLESPLRGDSNEYKGYTVDSRISKLKGPSETLRDIRISTYQIFSIEENTNRTPNFTNEYVIRLL